MSDRDTQKYYRARAAEYEQIYYRDNPQRRGEIDDEIVRVEKLVEGKSVLDLACGTGYWTEVIARTARSVTAIDLAFEMLTEARSKTYAAPVTFVEGDMFGYQPDELFDIVSVGFWFSHQPKQEYTRFFDLLRRLIRPGGRIWMIDNNPPAEGSTQHSVRVDEHGNNYKQRFLDDGSSFVILKNYFSQQELDSIFSTGFTVHSLVHRHYYWSVVLGLDD